MPLKPFHLTQDYRLLCRIIAGQVRSTVADHPDYFTPKGRRRAPVSVAKRAAGEIAALLLQQERAAKGGGVSPLRGPCAHPTAGGGTVEAPPPGEEVAFSASSPFLRDIRHAAQAQRDALFAHFRKGKRHE